MDSPSRRRIRAVLFDLDDTLWAIDPVIERAEAALYEWMREHAPRVPARYSIADLRARRMALARTDARYGWDVWGLRHAALCIALAECGEDRALADPAMDAFSVVRNQVTLYDDVAACLPRLAARLATGTVTNGPADLEAIGLAGHFRVSVAAAQLGRPKPDPAIFHAACEALDLDPAEVAYVGDDLRLDVEGAQQAGLAGLWLDRRGKPPKPEHAHIRPDARLTSLHELEDWLAIHGGLE